MHEDNEGHSPAAWIGVAVMLAAAVLACWGIVFGPQVLIPVGLGLFLVGAIAWYILARAGYGSDPETAKSSRV